MQKHTLPYLILTLLFAFFLLFHKQIALYADDWCYGVMMEKPSFDLGFFIQLTRQATLHYMGWSGRVASFLLIIVLTHYTALWKVMNTVVIMALPFFLFFLNKKTASGVNKNTVLLLSLILYLGVFHLDLLIIREVLFWLTGSITYFWSTVASILYFGILRAQLIEESTDSGAVSIFLFLLGGVLCYFQEQVTLIVLIGTTIFFLFTLAKRRRVFWHLLLLIFIVTHAYISFSAPGNTLRFNTQTDQVSQYYVLGTVEKVLFRAQNVFHSFFQERSIRLALSALCLFMAFSMRKYVKTKFRQMIVITPLIVAIFYFVFGANLTLFSFEHLSFTASYTTYGSYIVALTFVSILLLCSLYLSYKEKSPMLFALVCSGLVAHFVMIFAPSTPHRSLFPGSMYLWCAMIYLLYSLQSSKFFTAIAVFYGLFLFIFSDTIGPLIGLDIIFFILLANMAVLKKVGQTLKIATCVVIFFLRLSFVLLPLYQGYHENKQVYLQNIDALHRQNGAQLSLYTFPYLHYGFDMPYTYPDQKWMSECFSAYYSVPQHSKILWRDPN